ncbi:hypothetical protein Q4561_04740 [Alteromonas sp. 1_MG-2023]|uniref:hypothetical protein n=1 Tax=Alteromonas sp. 1_MG-2023 TaxID=3062669 RepID=UPI0026E18FE2|nr:hypothetical protein [Alteromonas sp. 1_MG-2023]MDO6566354.1 hypothetical protein [Alteromonas sp. 1_MG-2023]
MKQLVVGFIVLVASFNVHSASTSYGVGSIGYSDFEFTSLDDRGLTYSVAYGRQVHEQWYAEVGYLNLINDSGGDTELNGDALYLALLGKANNQFGELYYKLGIANADISGKSSCGNDVITGDACSFDEGVVAGIIGLGFDYYVGLKSSVRFEYVYLSGEDDLSAHLMSVGFRYKF